MIEAAMAEARRRHRRSIANAIQQLHEPDGRPLEGQEEVFAATVAQPRLNAAATVFVPTSEVNYSGASDIDVGCQWAQQGSWNAQGHYSWSDSNQCWDQSSSAIQVRINQAMLSAYHSYCGTEQHIQGVYDQYNGWQAGEAHNYAAVDSNSYHAGHHGVQLDQFGVDNVRCQNEWNSLGSAMCNAPNQDGWDAARNGNYHGESWGLQYSSSPWQ